MHIKTLVQCLAHGKCSINIEHRLTHTGINEAKGKKYKQLEARKEENVFSMISAELIKADQKRVTFLHKSVFVCGEA